MTKGQSLIIEFVLFFLISFSLFAVISYIFYNQNEFFKVRIGDKLTDIVDNLAVTHIIKSTGCKSCDYVKVQEDLPLKIGGYYYKIILKQDEGLNTTLISQKFYSRRHQLFHLNKTFSLIDSQSESENKIIEIQINNINKQVVID